MFSKWISGAVLLYYSKFARQVRIHFIKKTMTMNLTNKSW